MSTLSNAHPAQYQTLKKKSRRRRQFKHFLINPMFLSVILSLSGMALVNATGFSLYSNLTFLLIITSLLVYRRPVPVYVAMSMITIFYLYSLYSESYSGLDANDIRWLIVMNLGYGSLVIGILNILPLKSKEKSIKNIEDAHAKTSGVKVKDIIFINTIIKSIEQDSGLINDLISINAGRLREQVNKSHDIMISSTELKSFFGNINRSIGIIRSMSERAIESAMVGQSMLKNMEDEIKRLLGTMEKTSKLIKILGQATSKISEIIETIENIADQTNLLALNATIEAARAGEQGHSFAVVAEEIGKLAENTQKSTNNVIDMIESITTSTEIALEVVPKESAQAQVIVQSSHSILSDLRAILEAVEYLTDQIHEVSLVSKKQSGRAEDISLYIESISRFIRESSADVAEVYTHTDTLDLQSDIMQEIMDYLKFSERVDDPTKVFVELAEEFLEECTAVFEEGIKNGRISEKELFSRKYTPISGYTPPKYRSEFDRFTDEFISPVQEKYLGKDSRIDYFALVDDKGYCPTHNKKYSLGIGQSGESILDPNINRTKRIFSDPIAKKASLNTREKYIVQMYPRDTGDFINDLSMPFIFNGKHWGAVRIGFVFKV